MLTGIVKYYKTVPSEAAAAWLHPSSPEQHKEKKTFLLTYISKKNTKKEENNFKMFLEKEVYHWKLLHGSTCHPLNKDKILRLDFGLLWSIFAWTSVKNVVSLHFLKVNLAFSTFYQSFIPN